MHAAARVLCIKSQKVRWYSILIVLSLNHFELLSQLNGFVCHIQLCNNVCCGSLSPVYKWIQFGKNHCMLCNPVGENCENFMFLVLVRVVEIQEKLRFTFLRLINSQNNFHQTSNYLYCFFQPQFPGKKQYRYLQRKRASSNGIKKFLVNQENFLYLFLGEKISLLLASVTILLKSSNHRAQAAHDSAFKPWF